VNEELTMTDQYTFSTDDAPVVADTEVVVAAGTDDGNEIMI
jgi:hypothetical protein